MTNRGTVRRFTEGLRDGEGPGGGGQGNLLVVSSSSLSPTTLSECLLVSSPGSFTYLGHLSYLVGHEKCSSATVVFFVLSRVT